jgi:hypothetical protein
MSSECCRSKWAREIGKGGEGFYTPYTEKSRCSFKTQSIRAKSGNSGKSEDSRENPEIPTFQGQHPIR